METFSALLAICAGNSPVSGEFPAQRPVTRSFDVFFDVRLIKRLSKHSRGWWFETLSHPLWRHRNGVHDIHHWNVLKHTHILHNTVNFVNNFSYSIPVGIHVCKALLSRCHLGTQICQWQPENGTRKVDEAYTGWCDVVNFSWKHITWFALYLSLSKVGRWQQPPRMWPSLC